MKTNKLTIRIKDYIKGIKIADREMNLDNGFKSNHKAHKNKKLYNRKDKHRNNI